MRIDNEGMRRVLNRYIQQQCEMARVKDSRDDKSCAKKSEEETQSDRVTLSDQALQLRQASKELEAAAEARQEKVESIRKDLESGRYEVTGAMVAKKLLKP